MMTVAAIARRLTIAFNVAFGVVFALFAYFAVRFMLTAAVAMIALMILIHLVATYRTDAIAEAAGF